MKRSDFHIGLEFWCGGRRWCCTDVGSRVVVAISLEPHEVVSVAVDPNDRSKRTERRSMTDDPSSMVHRTESLSMCSTKTPSRHVPSNKRKHRRRAFPHSQSLRRKRME